MNPSVDTWCKLGWSVESKEGCIIFVWYLRADIDGFDIGGLMGESGAFGRGLYFFLTLSEVAGSLLLRCVDDTTELNCRR